MNYYPEFAELLNAELTRQDRTASWLAQRLGVNSSTVTRWLNHGTRPGTPSVVVRIADVLGISGQRQQWLVAAGYGFQEPAAELDDHTTKNVAVGEMTQTDGAAITDPENSELTPQRIGVRPPPLPLPATPLVGRGSELDFVARKLNDPDVRLLTVVGPGGMGKTRLALAAAHQQQTDARYKNGVAYTSLTALEHVAQVPAALANAVGLIPASVKESRTIEQQVVDFLRNRQLLLIVDNFEHLLDASVILERILQSAPDVQILTTSREMLGLPQEHLLQLRGLDFESSKPEDEVSISPAGELFEQAARRVRPDVEARAPDVSKICRMVEGMPLAIELAASWVSVLSVAEIVDEVQNSLTFLETDARGVPDRHRSVQAVFDATWQRLDVGAQQLFAALSVFRGGFTRAAAEVVAAADLRTLRLLSENSLITFDAMGERYAIHELLRQYGSLRLRDDPQQQASTRDRHSSYYIDLLSERQDDLKSSAEKIALDMLAVENDNLMAAWFWAVEQGNMVRLARCATGMALYFLLRGRLADGARAFDVAVSTLDQTGRDKTLIVALVWQARFELALGHRQLAEEFVTRGSDALESETIAATDTRFERALLDALHGALAFFRDFEMAIRHYESSVQLFEELGEHWHAGQIQLEIGDVLHVMGEYSRQKKWAEKALASYRTVHNSRGVATALAMLADINIFQGEWTAGLQMAQASLQVLRALHDPVGIGVCLRRIGTAHMYLGHVDEARRMQHECAAIFRDVGSLQNESLAYQLLHEVEMSAGNYFVARAYSERALQIAKELDDSILVAIYLTGFGWSLTFAGDRSQALEILNRAALAMDEVGGIGDRAQTYGKLAWTELLSGLIEGARMHAWQSLDLAVWSADRKRAPVVVGVITALLVQDGHATRAMELYGMLRREPYFNHIRWFCENVELYVDQAREGLPAKIVEAAQAKGEALDFWATVVELLDELRAMGWDQSS